MPSHVSFQWKGRRRVDQERPGCVTRKAEARAMRPRAQEASPSRGWGGRKGISLPASGEAWPCPHPGLGQVSLIWGFWPPRENRSLFWKPPGKG